VTIGADLPLSGDDAVDGLPVRDAIMLALAKAGNVCGASSHRDACVEVKPVMVDDVNKGIHDPATGAANIKRLASDHAVLGVVGPLYDSVARSEIPAANAAGLPLISPANTDVCLTQEPADGQCQGLAAKLRPHQPNTYFRVVTTELNEASAAADVSYRTLRAGHAFIVEGQSALAHALAASFRTRFIHDGGKLVDKPGADLIYFADSDLLAAATLRKQMTATNAQMPLVGTDALESDQFARAAGLSARGTYYTAVGAFPPNTKTAASFVAAYRQRYARDPSIVDLAAFDATGVLLNAIGRAIDDAGGQIPSRPQVLRELAATSSFSGAMGSFGFDARGDTSLKWVSVFQWLASTDRAGRFTAQIAVG
jgi:branched-chain amino acid transport system substrate-binding protein